MTTATEKALESLDFDIVLAHIAEHASTDPGRRRILALRPGVSDELLTLDFDRIEALISAVRGEEPLLFEGFRDLSSYLSRVAVPGTLLEPAELLDVRQSLSTSRLLKETLESRPDKLLPLAPLAEAVTPLPELERKIVAVVDSETAEVKDNASSELKRLRQESARLARKMRSRLENLVRKCDQAGWLRETGYSLRDGRFVLALNSTHRKKIRGILHGVSASGGTVYIEPDELVETGNEIRALEEREREEVRRILLEVTGLVRSQLPVIEATLDAVAELDSLQARARYALETGAFRPRTDAGELRIVEARHPLLLVRKGLEQTVTLNLAPNSAAPALVITGPNAGGKTVALKTVGLITLMAHSGIIPPCGDGTLIPRLESWHVVIGDEQSLEGDLSSFSGHLEKLKAVFDDPSAVKLVLVDEIAAGTDPEEGGALAMAFLENTLRGGCWTVVTTHIGAIKAFAHRTEGLRNGSMQFDRASLQPTYRFLPDLPGSSYALEIAARVGLPEKVVGRARELLGDQRQRLEELIDELSHKLGETERLQRDLDLRRGHASELEKLLHERLNVLEEKQAEITAESVRRAEEILREANRAVEQAVKVIREQKASREAIRSAHQIVEKHQRAVADFSRQMVPKQRPVAKEKARPSTADESSGTLLEGDEVLLRNGERAKVLALRGDRVQVAVGMIRLWLSKTEIRKTGGSEKPAGGGVRVHLHREDNDERIPLELKLLGMRAIEAEAALEKYIEDLVVSGLSRARIVHGKGTGALRTLVQDFARHSPHVRSFRYGTPEEGGYGVTIFELE